MWAMLCGVVSSGVPVTSRIGFLATGIALAGPLVCGTSQAVNDWFDRHVDAINEPDRPIPSGRVPGRWGLAVAVAGSFLSMLVAATAGLWVVLATLMGLACAWAYSAPPFRFKTSGWVGPAVVAISYEGLSWFTGAAVMLGTLPDRAVLWTLLLYSVGAHGIMTLNDFKAVKGDRATGLRSLPVILGERRAALLACAVMALPQMLVAGLLWRWAMTASAIAVLVLLLIQMLLMPRLVSAPARHAPWYNATGVSLYVLGMMAAALGLGDYV